MSDDDKSDIYNSSGQAGAVGANAHSHHNTFNRTDNSKKLEVTTKVQGDRSMDIGSHISASTIIPGDGNIVVTGGNPQIHQPAVVPPPPALHEMPPPSRDFVGRKKEMKELLKALEKNGITISGLQGMGGVGKTALALKLAQHLKPKYPDAQFYLDLKGASHHPLTTAEALAHVIRAYYPQAQLPEDESSLRGLYLSLLEEKKALLLMDNAATAAQVEPLIPPPSCILLVTSRNRFTIDGLVAKNLDTLAPKDAEKLLLQLAPRIGNCAEKIAKLCDYLPLALRLAAGALHKLVMLTPEEYVERLSEETEKLGLIEASLSLSYDLLTEEMQKLWRVLAVFPTTFDTAAVTALWGLSVKETQNRLAELISYSLIEWNETTRRYRLHDLLKLLAQARLSQEERYVGGKLHAFYYRQVLAQAGSLYFEGSDRITQGLSLFDLERDNIESGQNWAAANIDAEEEVTCLSMEYYNAAYYLLGLRLHPHEDIRWLEISLKAARKLGNKAFQSYALGNLGVAYAALGEPRKAIEYHEQSLVIKREIGDRRGEGAVLGNLGVTYAALGEPRKAIEFYEQCLVITREIGNRRGEGQALGNLGNAYADLGETHKAIEYHEQALLIDREIGDRRGEGQDLGNLGNTYRNLGETHKAIEFYAQQLVITREIGDRQGEGNAFSGLGNAYFNLGETRKAIEYHKQHLEIAHEIGDRRGEGNALWNSALAYDELGDRAQAISLAEIALAIYEQIESPMASAVRSTLDRWRAGAE